MPVTEEERRKYEDEMEAKGKKHEEEKKRQAKEYDEEFSKLHAAAWNDHTEAIQKWRVEEDDYKHGYLKDYEAAMAHVKEYDIKRRNPNYPMILRKKLTAPKKPVFKEAVVPNARRRFPLLGNSYFGGRRLTRRGRKTRSTRRR
jgi:hypothetical protein